MHDPIERFRLSSDCHNVGPPSSCLDLRRRSRAKMFVEPSYHLPAAELLDRFAELSAPQIELVILVDQDATNEVGGPSESITTDDECIKVFWREFFRSHKWPNVRVCLEPQDAAQAVHGSITPKPPLKQVPLWRPNALLKYWCGVYLEEFTESDEIWFLDLGSGVCRDAAFFASVARRRQLRTRILCVEQRRLLLNVGRKICEEVGFEQCQLISVNDWKNLSSPRQLASLGGVATNTSEETLQNCRVYFLACKIDSDFLDWCSESFDVVHASRFFDRSILEQMVLNTTKDWILFHAFLEGSVRPRGPDKVLFRGELRSFCTQPESRQRRSIGTLAICLDDEIEEHDHLGLRVLSHFAARKLDKTLHDFHTHE